MTQDIEVTGHHLIEMFSEDRIAFQRELQHEDHEEIRRAIAANGLDEFEDIVAGVAAACDIQLDGEYQQWEIDRLCGILVERLKQKRGGVILTSN